MYKLVFERACRTRRSMGVSCLIAFALTALLGTVAFGVYVRNARSNFYANSIQEDTTPATVFATTDPYGRNATVLSAYFGLDNHLPAISNIPCAHSGGKDGMPLVFSHELDPDTIQAGDFEVTDMQGVKSTPFCSTLRPAISPGELRTVLLMGEFGKEELRSVCVVGNIWDISKKVNFKSNCVKPKPISSVVELVFAEVVPPEQKPDCGALDLGAGGKVIRAVWDGGVSLAGGKRVPPTYASKYNVTLADGTTITPTLLGDVADVDNNHLLCFSAGAVQSKWRADNMPVLVSFAAGYLTDPNEDGTNRATSVSVTLTPTTAAPRLTDAQVTAQAAGWIAGAVAMVILLYIFGFFVFAKKLSLRANAMDEEMQLPA